MWSKINLMSYRWTSGRYSLEKYSEGPRVLGDPRPYRLLLTGRLDNDCNDPVKDEQWILLWSLHDFGCCEDRDAALCLWCTLLSLGNTGRGRARACVWVRLRFRTGFAAPGRTAHIGRHNGAEQPGDSTCWRPEELHHLVDKTLRRWIQTTWEIIIGFHHSNKINNGL